MGERLQLSLDRIREIPDEVDQITPYGAFFASISRFFLYYLQEEESSVNYLSGLLSECMESCKKYVYPKDALEKDDLGDILSVLLYISLGIVYEDEERAICRVLELFIELYLQFAQFSKPEKQSLKDILYAHFHDYCGEFLEEWKQYFLLDSGRESGIPGKHNLLFPLFFLERSSSPYFSEEYEEAHRNDIALILGSRLLSRLEQEWKRLISNANGSFCMDSEREEKSLDLELSGEIKKIPWSISPHALNFHEHQKKILEGFEKKYR